MAVDPRLTAGPPRHRVLFWGAVALAVAVAVAGTVAAVVAWRRTTGPEGTVRAYFDALADGDAARALAYGTVPAGDRGLLRDDVLRLQQRTAPLDEVRTRTTARHGDRARVEVRYRLRFAGRAYREVVSTVGVHDGGDGWRLDAAAVATQLLVGAGSDRVTLAGRAVPEGTTLLFPGAVPVRTDTAWLGLDPDEGDVAFGAGASTEVRLLVTATGRRSALTAVRAAVTRCLSTATPDPDPRCPVASEQDVPGSVRGVVTAGVPDLTVGLLPGAAGALEVRGDLAVRGGYRRLGFDDTVTVRRGVTFTLPVDARLYPVGPSGPDSVTWVTPS